MQSFGIWMRKNSEDPVHAAISFSPVSRRKNIWKCPKLHDWTAGPNVFISSCWKCFKTVLFPTLRLNLLLTITTRWQACTFQCLKCTLPCRRLRKCLLALQMELQVCRIFSELTKKKHPQICCLWNNTNVKIECLSYPKVVKKGTLVSCRQFFTVFQGCQFEISFFLLRL